MFTNAGSLIGGGTFIVDPMTFTNTGYVGLTVTLAGGSELDNAATGTVRAIIAVYGTGAAATVLNAGTISSGLAVAIDLRAGGSVNNSGTITAASGAYGVRVFGGVGTVANTGIIIGDANLSHNAVLLDAGGYVTNAGSGTITGGVYIVNGTCIDCFNVKKLVVVRIWRA